MISRRQFLFAWLAAIAGCSKPTPAFRNTDLTGKAIGGDFSLNDFHGQPRSPADFQGKAIILFFGYASCPDICPTALAKFAELLREPGMGADRVQVIFISLDPERDTAHRLSEYATWFHPSFLALTDNRDKIDEVAQKFRVTRIKKEVSGGMGYVLDHSAGAYVFGPDGRLRLYLAENAKIKDIAGDLRRLLAGE